jgi:hypothetical protein
VPTVALLKDENKFHDLIVSFVEMQLALLNWSVNDQSRGGSSASGGTAEGGAVGERDWVVRRQTRELCVCEALRLSSVDASAIDKHLKKLLDRYNPQGATISLLLVYFEGRRFDDFAQRYKAHIETIQVPDWALDVEGDWHESGSHLVRSFRAQARREGIAVSVDHVLVNVEAAPEAHASSS